MKAAKFWQKTDPGLRAHPAFLDLVEELGTSPLMADGLLHGLWAMAFNDAPDGDLTRFKPRALARAIGWPHNGEKMIEALLAAGFLEYVTVTSGDEKLVIHDWFDWGGALFKQRAETRVRVARHREIPAQSNSVTDTVTVGNSYPRAEIEIEKKKSKSFGDEKPSPLRFDEDFEKWWVAYGRVGNKALARDCYRYWRGKGFSADRLLAAIPPYITDCIANDRTVQHAATFLKKKLNCWEEWITEEHGSSKPSPNGNGKKRECPKCGVTFTYDEDQRLRCGVCGLVPA